MDFKSRTTETEPSQAASSSSSTKFKTSKREAIGAWTRTGYAVLLFAITIIIVAVGGLIAFGLNSEGRFVTTSKYQEVVVNNGTNGGQSVYFGHIVKVTDQYVVLQNVFFPASAAPSSTYAVTKLGCQQPNSPYDQVVLNQNQVALWENLQDNGKVVTAINQFLQSNPSGPNCDDASGTVTGTPPPPAPVTAPTTSSSSTPTTATTTK